jgi:hypothetical protein
MPEVKITRAGVSILCFKTAESRCKHEDPPDGSNCRFTAHKDGDYLHGYGGPCRCKEARIAALEIWLREERKKEQAPVPEVKNGAKR